MSKSKKAPSKAMVLEVIALAREMGWIELRPQEKHLIDLLRNTTYHGRNLVVETAIAMHRAHPWQSDRLGTEYPSNTATSFPADRRFFTKEKQA